MDEIDLTKRDITVVNGARTLAPRAYRQANSWQNARIEHRTPMGRWLARVSNAPSSLAALADLPAPTVDAAADTEKFWA